MLGGIAIGAAVYLGLGVVVRVIVGALLPTSGVEGWREFGTDILVWPVVLAASLLYFL